MRFGLPPAVPSGPTSTSADLRSRPGAAAALGRAPEDHFTAAFPGMMKELEKCKHPLATPPMNVNESCLLLKTRRHDNG